MGKKRIREHPAPDKPQELLLPAIRVEKEKKTRRASANPKLVIRKNKHT